MQQALVRLEIERAEWKVAEFLSLKLGDGVLDVTLVTH